MRQGSAVRQEGGEGVKVKVMGLEETVAARAAARDQQAAAKLAGFLAAALVVRVAREAVAKAAGQVEERVAEMGMEERAGERVVGTAAGGWVLARVARVGVARVAAVRAAVRVAAEGLEVRAG